MSSGSYLQAYVRCPFYKYDDGKKRITCEGLLDESSIALIYSKQEDFQIQINTFCCEHYEKCEIHCLLQALKYDDQCISKPEKKTKKNDPNGFEAVFKDYKGRNRFKASHPAKGKIRVAAPDKTAALVAAAEFWGERWQDCEFYMDCSIEAIK